MRKVSDKSYRENQNTDFMFNNVFFNHAVYDIMWTNVQSGRTRLTIRRTRIACWMQRLQTHSHNM